MMALVFCLGTVFEADMAPKLISLTPNTDSGDEKGPTLVTPVSYCYNDDTIGGK